MRIKFMLCDTRMTYDLRSRSAKTLRLFALKSRRRPPEFRRSSSSRSRTPCSCRTRGGHASRRNRLRRLVEIAADLGELLRHSGAFRASPGHARRESGTRTYVVHARSASPCMPPEPTGHDRRPRHDLARSGRSTALSSRISVDLPAPLRPMSPTFTPPGSPATDRGTRLAAAQRQIRLGEALETDHIVTLAR